MLFNKYKCQVGSFSGSSRKTTKPSCKRDTMAVPVIQPGVTEWSCGCDCVSPLSFASQAHCNNQSPWGNNQGIASCEMAQRGFVMWVVRQSKLEVSEIRNSISGALPRVWEPQGCQWAHCRSGSPVRSSSAKSPSSSHGSLKNKSSGQNCKVLGCAV